MVRITAEKYRLLGWLSFFLVAGFLATSVTAYTVSRDSIRSGIAEQALPLTADNIYSEIQKDILRPVFISSLMAQDTFVRDWILGGERDTGQIVRYLGEVKAKYGTISSFLVSENSRKYYFSGGILKTVRQSEPADKWFFRVRNMAAPYETNVDFDLANRGAMTVFINYRVLDYRGKFIGVTGVGLTLDAVGRLIDSYQARFRRSIYFVDARGVVVLSGKSTGDIHGSIRELPGISAIAGDILQQNEVPKRLEFRRNGTQVLANSRFIPELGWYLVVEQDENEELKAVKRVFALNLALSVVASLLVLGVTLLAVNRYQRRLEQLATTDSLTGLLNRQGLDILFHRTIAEAKRSNRPFCVILLDIDLFKEINDTRGHLEGDRVLCEIAALMRGAFRECDVLVRWGGEEFLALLEDCTLEHAVKAAEKLRLAVAGHDFAVAPSAAPVRISLGVAEYARSESETAFLARADQALYRAKQNGRNRTEASPIDERAGSSTTASGA